jgi:8-amino-7-oxononanoate synthase
MLYKELKRELESLRDQNLLRSRNDIEHVKKQKISIKGKWYINFSSNDYLGLSQDASVKKTMVEGIKSFGCGAGASHLISGHIKKQTELEKKIARLIGMDHGLLFSSGYMANLAFFTTMIAKSDAVFIDKLNHASLNQGVLASGSRFYRYAHLDMKSLEIQLKQSHAKKKWIVTDGVFSMDGDVADVPALVRLCKKYDAYLYIDDAHGYGVLGKNGQGILSHFKGIEKKDFDRIIYLLTFGKSMGLSGSVLCSKKIIGDYMMQKAKPYIYTTAQNPSISLAALTSLEIIKNKQILRTHLNKLIKTFREQIDKKELLGTSITPIQPIILKDEKKVLSISKKLMRMGYYVSSIRPPTVEKNTSRLRISLSALHSLKDVLGLTQALNSLMNSHAI